MTVIINVFKGREFKFMSSGNRSNLVHFPPANVKLKKLYPKKFFPKIYFSKKKSPYPRMDADKVVKLYPLIL